MLKHRQTGERYVTFTSPHALCVLRKFKLNMVQSFFIKIYLVY